MTVRSLTRAYAMDGLTTGRVIHVNDIAGKCQAGIVAKVRDNVNGLINAGGFREYGGPAAWSEINFDPTQETDYGWHWPERA